MANWRSGDDKRKRKSGKPAGKQSGTPKPASKKDRGSWKMSKDSVRDSAKSTEWSAAQTTSDVAERAMYTHRLKILVLCGVLAVFVGYLIWRVSYSPRRLPLIMINVADYLQKENRQFLVTNPFSQEDAERFRKVNTSSVMFVQADSDTLADIRKNDDGLRQEMARNPARPIPGGPSKDMFVFFVSAYGAIDKQDQGGLLLSDSDINDSSTWLPVEKILRQIEDVTASHGELTRAVVLLDIKFPDPIAATDISTYDFSKKVAELITDAGLKHKNLYVLISANSDQDSWTSAELGGSVFGYYCARALNGAGGTSGSITIAELFQYVKQSVETWTAQHRHAAQIPVLLTTTEDEDPSSRVIAFRPDSGGTRIQPDSVAGNVTKRAQDLLPLWKIHDRLKSDQAYNKNPILWGRAEARLIRLEQLLESGHSEAYNSLKEAAAKDLKDLGDLNDNSDRQPESLVEWEVLQPSAQEHLKPILAEWLAKQPPYLRPPSEEGKEVVEEPLTGLTRRDIQWITWKWLTYEPEIDGPQAGLPSSYDQAGFEKILNFIENAAQFPAEDKPPEWIEPQFLWMLLLETDWSALDAASGTVVARDSVVRQALLARKYSQQAAIWKNPIVHYWLQNRLEHTELQRRLAEDLLMAGRLEEAKDLYDPLLSELDQIHKYGRQVAHALSIKDQALVELPHYIAWERRYSAIEGVARPFRADISATASTPTDETGQDDQQRPKETGELSEDPLADLWRDVFELAKLLRMLDSAAAAGDNSIRIAAERVEKRLVDLRQDFQQHVESLTTGPGNNLHHRRIQAALATALVKADDRSSLYAALGKIVSTNKDEKGIDQSLIDLVIRGAGEKSPANRFEERFGNDFRGTQLESSFAQLGISRWDEFNPQNLDVFVQDLQKAQDKLDEYRRWVSLASDFFKVSGLFQAFRSEAAPNTRPQVEIVAGNCYQIHVHFERVWQAERVLADFWGNPRPQNRTLAPYFSRCCSEYIATAMTVRQDSSLLSEFRTRRIARENALGHLKISPDDRIYFHSQEREKRHQVRVDHQTDLPNGYARLQLSNNNSTIEVVDKDTDLKTRAHFVEVMELPTSRSFEHYIGIGDLAAVSSGRLDVELLYRGHRVGKTVRVHERRVPAKPETYDIVHEKKPYQEPRVRVRGLQSGMLDVLFVLDCSASMNETIPVDETGNLRLTRHEAAKNSLFSILDRMSEEAGRYRLGLLAFGHRARWTGRGWETQRFNEESDVFVPEDVEVVHALNSSGRPTDLIELARLKQNLLKLRAAGSTPLYLAITKGLEHLRNSRREGVEQRLIVISDGVNVQEEWNDSAVKANAMRSDYKPTLFSDLEADVGKLYGGIGISIVHYHPKDKDWQAKNIKGYVERLRDAKKIPQLSTPQGKYFEPNKYEQVRAALEETLPRTVFYVAQGDAAASGEGNLLGTTISCNRFPLPQKHRVFVNEDTPTEIEIEGGEDVELTYDSTSRLLRFEPFSVDPFRSLEKILGGDEYLVRMHRPILRDNMVGFEFSFSNRSDLKFSRRPQMLWLEVRQRYGGEDKFLFDCYDYQFANRQTAPVAKFAYIPRFENRTDLSADIKLWISMEPISGEPIVFEEANLEHDLGADTAAIRREGREVFVLIKAKDKSRVGRWMVRCPQQVRVKRIIERTGLRVEHVFTLNDSVGLGQPIKLEFLSHQQVTGQCQEVEISDISIEDR